MEDEPDSDIEILLKKYANGRIPPLIDMAVPASGLIDKDLFEVYQAGVRQVLFRALGVQLPSAQFASREEKWGKANNLPLEANEESWTRFCATLRERESGDEECIACDRHWACRAEKEDRAIAYMCVHGMIDFAVPIKVHGMTIAVVFTGQHFPKPGANWNPELIRPGGLFCPLEPGKPGVDAWAESKARIHQAEQKYGFLKDALINELYKSTEQEVTPEDVTKKLNKLGLLRKQISQLASARLESERGRIRSWILSGIVHSLAQLETEVSTDVTSSAKLKGVVDISATKLWRHMSQYLRHTREYLGFAHLAVLSVDTCKGGGTISLLVHHGRSSAGFHFPQQYDCTERYASLEDLASKMTEWQTATQINLDRYESLPVIEHLFKSLGRRRSVATYAVAGRVMEGIPPILVVGGLDYRKRATSLSSIEIDDFTAISKEIELVANLCNLVFKLDDETERQARFIEDVAHDIRNPIQNLITTADYLQIDSLSIEATRKKAKEMAAEVRRINDLSQRVWVLEELRRGVLDPRQCRSVKVFEIVMRCRKSLDYRASKRGLSIEVDRKLESWPGVRVNEDLLFHTVLNIMDNAIKYSSENTEVRVGGWLEPGECVLTFGNVGIGVPNDEKGRIFDRYYRAKNAQMTVREGTGIGLSIVKAFADSYGEIEFESNPLERSSRHLTVFRLKIRRS